MARRNKKDHGLNSRMDEIERKMFLLKMQYEKYFTGIERIEPMKEREALKRILRDMTQEHITNTQQRYRFIQLKARMSSLELYWQRNLVMIERGTHPKMKFRANLKDQTARDRAILAKQRQERKVRFNSRQQEEKALKMAFDTLIQARKKTGQNTNLNYDSVRETLRKQSRMIKSQHQCERVKFRVQIQDGKAKMKAVPIKKDD
jgi:hypothetical protein